MAVGVGWAVVAGWGGGPYAQGGGWATAAGRVGRLGASSRPARPVPRAQSGGANFTISILRALNGWGGVIGPKRGENRSEGEW